MAIIIAGFATCGKSVLGRKYKNVIDLESSLYKHKMAMRALLLSIYIDLYAC